MGKKKVSLNSSPLESVTIGEIKQNKFGWIKIVLLFLLFFGLIFYLPEISKKLTKYYNMYIKGETVSVDNSVQTTNLVIDKEDESESKPKEDIKYEISDTTVVELNDIKYSNFSFTNNVLKFAAVNPTEKKVKLENTFIELYDANGSLINRALVYGTIDSQKSINFSYNINGQISYFYLKTIDEEDYTYTDFNKDKDGFVILTCTKDTESITYKIGSASNENIEQITHKFTYNKSLPDFDDIYRNYNTLALNYANTSGIKVTSNLNGDNYNFEFIIDYNVFSDKIDKYEYFSKYTKARVIFFEMESLFYTCK